MNSQSKETVLIVCGEHSGDLLGSRLVEEMRKRNPNLEFVGIAGDEMLKHNVRSIAEIETMNVVGFTAIAFKYRYLKSLAGKLVEEAKANHCKFAILIDYPGFNLRLAKMLKAEGLKVVFYVSPQIWAWKYNRVYTIKEVVDLMLVLFPFEKEIYDSHQIPCVYTGHPLTDRIQEKLKIEDPILLEKKDVTICLMPGSRTSEVKKLLTIIFESALRIQKYLKSQNKQVQFLLPNISKRDEDYILNHLRSYQEKNPDFVVHYFFDRSIRCIEAADLVIMSSGTATLEVTYFEKPMVILYKASFITYILAEILLRSEFLGLVNILSGEEVCREFLQYKGKPINVYRETVKILEDQEYRNNMVEKLKKVKKSLNLYNASEKAATSILEWFTSQS